MHYPRLDCKTYKSGYDQNGFPLETLVPVNRSTGEIGAPAGQQAIPKAVVEQFSELAKQRTGKGVTEAQVRSIIGRFGGDVEAAMKYLQGN